MAPSSSRGHIEEGKEEGREQEREPRTLWRAAAN